MILLYHKIDPENKTEWWVSVDAFYRQLVQLSGKKVVYLDDYDPSNPDHVVITFDGIYTNILKYAAPLLKKFNYPFELFITEDYIGKSNIFDEPEPACSFASVQDLENLIKLGGRLQWHSKTHIDVTTLSGDLIEREIVVPEQFKQIDKKGFKWYAYAYGRFDKRAQEIVKKHYKGGLACENGSFKDISVWPRQIVREDTQLSKTKLSVIVTSYNYGHFLVEAIESVLRQTYLPDELLLSDDASTDHSYQIMKAYARKYPQLIKVNRNNVNLGVEEHFRRAVAKTKGDYICFLGADNRMPSNYLSEHYAALSRNKQAAIAYGDFALFGARAEYAYSQHSKERKGKKLPGGVFLINFPDMWQKSQKELLAADSFMHGSSMYKREAYEKAGGYKSREIGPEDYTLFRTMISRGYGVVKVKDVYLEYRQHSADQANQQFSYFAENNFLKDQFIQLTHRLETEIPELQKQIDEKNIVFAHRFIMQK